MAKLIDGVFDATKVDPTQSGGGNLPVGKHPVIIEASDIKANSNNDGGYLAFELRVTDGPAAGAAGTWRLNLYNKSAQAVEIARHSLSALCHATGVFQTDDTTAFHNIPFMVEVGLQKGTDAAEKGYTEVKKVLYANGGEPGKDSPNNGPTQPSNAGGGQGGAGWHGEQRGQGGTNQGAQGGQGGQGGGWGGGGNQGGNQGQQQPPQNQGGGAGWGGGNGGNNQGQGGGSGGGWGGGNTGGGNQGGNTGGGWGNR